MSTVVDQFAVDDEGRKISQFMPTENTTGNAALQDAEPVLQPATVDSVTKFAQANSPQAIAKRQQEADKQAQGILKAKREKEQTQTKRLEDNLLLWMDVKQIMLTDDGGHDANQTKFKKGLEKLVADYNKALAV